MAKMKCEVNSETTHEVLISKETSYKSYNEICRGEPKEVNLGYNYEYMAGTRVLKVENNTLMHEPSKTNLNTLHVKYGARSFFSENWEVLSKFISIHNIEPNWLDCNSTWGWYDEDLGGWTGCMGKV